MVRPCTVGTLVTCQEEAVIQETKDKRVINVEVLCVDWWIIPESSRPFTISISVDVGYL